MLLQMKTVKSTADKVRSDRPSDVATQENVNEIREMVWVDRKVTGKLELADTTRISTDRTSHILGEILHMN